MNIYTGYYAAVNKYSNVIPIAISGKPPKHWKYLYYNKLAPSYNIWKQCHDSNDLNKFEIYTNRFQNEILNHLHPNEVFIDLVNLSGGANFILCCYEKPPNFCHRHLVAKWLNHYLNLNIYEYQI